MGNTHPTAGRPPGGASSGPPGRDAITYPKPAEAFAPFPGLPDGDPDTLDGWLDAALVKPVSAVDWKVSTAWELGPRVVHDNMWFWFRRGTGTARVGPRGRPFRVGPGGVMLIPQDVEHHIRQDAGVEMELVTVHFFSSVYGGINLLELLGFPAWLPPAEDAPYERINVALPREAAVRAPGWRGAMEGLIRELLLYAVRHAGAAFQVRVHGELPRLIPALAHIDMHLGQPNLRMGDLARKVHMSEVQFRKLFRRVTGASPSRFIQRRRIDHACTLLRDPSMTIDQVARAAGFSDAPFFCRVFKQWVGTTPGHFRHVETF